MKKITLKLLKFYRNYLSCMKIQCCRYTPTCSQYAIDSVHKYGALKGLIKTAIRVVRCNPFTRGGYDPA